MKIKTARLELIAGTPELAQADLENRARFAELLGARVPEDWPPPLNDRDSQQWVVRYLAEHPDGVGWSIWYFVLPESVAGERIAIGNGGFKGLPAPDGTVEVGYSVMEEFQKRGYATEAVGGLIRWAFSHTPVARVIAETYPELQKSVRVMLKNGLVFIGDGSEPRVIRYELTRQAFETQRRPDE
ncbi:MAG: GNAT family N-acetyltransferase [Acidobacteria bacterium]|nr:GNAT family N-acetyltransferase [Acidobacteriota bacterium]